MTLLERLGLENQVLLRDGLSQFQIHRSQSGESFFLWGNHKTSAGNSYSIYGPLPGRYPDSRPPIYLYEPNPLYGYGYSRTINSYGLSHYMHTLSNGPSGMVQICHWREDRWHSGITLNKVVIKVLLWLEAYEQHLSTGQTISEFVSTMQQ